MTAVEEYQEAKAAIAEQRAKLTSVLNDAFTSMVKSFFDDNPKIESFSWQQFTQYFNDGDTCYFDVRADADCGLRVNEETEEEVEGRPEYKDFRPEGGDCDYDAYTQAVKSWRTKTGDLFSKAESFLAQFADEDFLELFGDHVEVTVDREGVNVEEYTEHD